MQNPVGVKGLDLEPTVTGSKEPPHDRESLRVEAKIGSTGQEVDAVGGNGKSSHCTEHEGGKGFDRLEE